jgi:predicted DNA binding CopG/RHH family protein
MIRRNDLAKQFELVVKQEVKNHNDSILATNISIEDIRKEIRSMEARHQAEMLLIKEQILDFKLKFNSISEKNDNQKSKLDSHIHDSSRIAERNHRNYENVMSDLDKVDQVLKSHDRKHSQISHDKNFQSEQFESLAKDIRIEIRLECARTMQHAKALCKAIEDKPSEVDKLRDEISERLSASNIDVKGVYQEIDAFKRDCYYVEKKLENIYTLIERLQKKVN